MRKYIQIIKESYLNYSPRLEDEREIAAYISDMASAYVDTDMIEEYFHGCHAVLQLVSVNEIEEGDPDTNIRSKAKEKRYAKMEPATIPPIVIENGKVMDGNHRFRVAQAQGVKALWCYVVSED